MLFQLAHLREKPLGRIEVQCGGRFVENEYLWIGEKGAGNRDPLFDAQRQITDECLQIEFEAEEFAYQRGGLRDFLLWPLAGAKQTVGPDIKIVEHRALIGDEHFLIYVCDP